MSDLEKELEAIAGASDPGPLVALLRRMAEELDRTAKKLDELDEFTVSELDELREELERRIERVAESGDNDRRDLEGRIGNLEDDVHRLERDR